MSESPQTGQSMLQKWNAIPLYLRILIAMVIGILTGMALGEHAAVLEIPSTLILQLLGALAPPLILIAVTHVLMTSDITGKTALRIGGVLLLNTSVAILIGLGVANVMQPGTWSEQTPKFSSLAADATTGANSIKVSNPAQFHVGDSISIWDNDSESEVFKIENIAGSVLTLSGELKENVSVVKNAKVAIKDEEGDGPNPIGLLLKNVPKSILGPLGDQTNIIGIIVIAVAFGIAMRAHKDQELRTVRDFVELAYELLLKLLHWIIQLVPIGVFAVVAKVIGTEGFEPFALLGAFVLCVLIALALQTCWYLLRIKLFSWAKPLDVLRGIRDPLVMAFSTGSSTATMPVTYAALKDEVGLREDSASMGALVGANFNNDGTALYEAMAALFIAQWLGMELSFSQQLLVVFTSIIASVGAAGIPEAGLVTMTLVFTAVGLPTEYIALLLTVDWFLDRCRTTINVLGDVNVSCILDGRTRQETGPPVEPGPAIDSA